MMGLMFVFFLFVFLISQPHDGQFSQSYKWKNCRGRCFSIFHLVCLFLAEEIQYHDGLRSRELGQAPILLCGPTLLCKLFQVL